MASTPPGDITQLLERWRAGSAAAGDQVVTRTYDELRRIAHRQMHRERRDHTLQTTALLNEAYLRLVRDHRLVPGTRDAFFRLMAAEMRRRLIDHARRRLAGKRGGRIVHDQLKSSQVGLLPHLAADDLEATYARLDHALEELTQHFPRAARVVQLRFLCDLTIEAIAAELALSPGTVKRDWTFARAWLAAALERETAQ